MRRRREPALSLSRLRSRLSRHCVCTSPVDLPVRPGRYASFCVIFGLLTAPGACEMHTDTERSLFGSYVRESEHVFI